MKLSAPSLHTESELLLQASQGKEEAFTALFLQHRHKLYGFLLQLTHSPEVTEDIIQEVFLKLWQKREELVKIEQFGSYLFRMAQNKAVNIFRKTARETLLRANLPLKEPVTDATDGAEAMLIANELHQKIKAALHKLSPQQRLVYQLSRESGLKHEQIALQLNISPSTVNNHLIAALRVIRQELAPYLNQPGSLALFALLTLLPK